MKSVLLFPLVVAAALAAGESLAQSQQSPLRVWRCGNTYTNNAAEAQSHGCKLIEGGNVTVVEGTRVNAPAAGVKVATAPQAASAGPGQRVDAGEQRARDAEARSILEAELKKAEQRQADLVKEYNNGEPEKQGAEHRNYQKYLDRVAELKASITRNENDIAGLRRELGRAAGTASK